MAVVGAGVGADGLWFGVQAVAMIATTARNPSAGRSRRSWTELMGSAASMPERRIGPSRGSRDESAFFEGMSPNAPHTRWSDATRIGGTSAARRPGGLRGPRPHVRQPLVLDRVSHHPRPPSGRGRGPADAGHDLGRAAPAAGP